MRGEGKWALLAARVSCEPVTLLEMGQLLEDVRRAVRVGRYVFSDHADNMLRERGIMHWQVVEDVEQAQLLSERSGTTPNPTVELEQMLPDGTSVKAVWAFIEALDLAKLVTVHFFDR